MGKIDIGGDSDDDDAKTTPEYTIELQYEGQNQAQSLLPSTLSVKIQTPLLSSMKGVDLDVQTNQLSLDSSLYVLKVFFPLRVNGDEASAKFSKKRKELSVTLPVLKREMQPNELVENVERARKEYISLNEIETTATATAAETAAETATATATATASATATAAAAAATAKTETAAPTQPPPPPVARTETQKIDEPTHKSLYEKYSKVKSQQQKQQTAPTTAIEAIERDLHGQRQHQNLKILGHETDDLGLVSSEALIEILESLVMAAAKHGSLNENGLLQSTLSQLSSGQAEFVRQTLREAVMRCEQPRGNLPDDVKQNFIKLCEMKMRKLRGVMEEVRKRQIAAYEQKTGAKATTAVDSVTSGKYSTHAHAPTFQKGDNYTSADNDMNLNVSRILPEADIIKGDNLSSMLITTAKGSKKKVARDKVKSKSKKIAALLSENSYAVMDNFVDEQTVRMVRAEIDSLDPHFTPSEIWVGKGADVGAQITVPDVRGDKVLWMCGGHLKKDSSLFDSAGEQPKGRGAIEPCDRKVKDDLGTKIDKGGSRSVSASVMHQFSKMKVLLESIDKLVFGELTNRVERLSRLTARSDAM